MLYYYIDIKLGDRRKFVVIRQSAGFCLPEAEFRMSMPGKGLATITVRSLRG
jgi:hypothetical protein